MSVDCEYVRLVKSLSQQYFNKSVVFHTERFENYIYCSVLSYMNFGYFCARGDCSECAVQACAKNIYTTLVRRNYKHLPISPLKDLKSVHGTCPCPGLADEPEQYVLQVELDREWTAFIKHGRDEKNASGPPVG